MSLDSYANLKTEIADWLDRDDLTSQIDTFIDLAEARFNREVRIRELVTRANLTISSRQTSFPSGAIEIYNLKLLSDPVTVLQEVSIHEMNRYRVSTTGKPKLYTQYGQTIEVDKSPDQSYTGEIIYYPALTDLDGTDTTNAILQRAPDLYLYGSLLAAEPFLWNDERIQIWNEYYKSALEAVNQVDRRRAGPLASRVVGNTP